MVGCALQLLKNCGCTDQGSTREGLDGNKPKTQNEIAQEMGISRSYVSRIETKAIGKLAKEIRE